MSIAAITVSGGAALMAVGAVAVSSLAGLLVALGLRPLVVKAIDYAERQPPGPW